MKNLRLFVVMLAMVAGLIGGPVFADHNTPGGVAATVTPGLVSVSLSQATVGYGTVELSTSSTLSFAELTGQDCATPTAVFNAQNTGNLNAEFNISGGDSFQTVTGAISAFSGSTGSKPTLVTAAILAAASLTPGDSVFITGTTNYNGEHTIAGPTGTTFFIPVALAGTETGTWFHGLDSGSIGTGWDLDTRANVLGTTVNLYSHSYTSFGGGDANACEVAGTESTSTSGSVAVTEGPSGDGIVVVTTGGVHGLVTGDVVVISGTTDYNGSFTIEVTSTTEFLIADTYVSDQSGGTFIHEIVLTDGELSTSQSPLASLVTLGSSVNVFLELTMPVDTTQGSAVQTMPVRVQVALAGP